MRAVILGGGGAIGSAIVRYAGGRGIETHAIVRASTSLARLRSRPASTVHECDLADSGGLSDLVRSLQPDLIVNAASTSGHADSDDARRQLLLGMAHAVLGLFAALRDATFKGRLVLLGSAMSYGPGGRPRRASDPLRAQTFRGAVKAAESGLAAQMGNEFGIALTELRVFTGYGPFEQRERLVPQLLRAALTGAKVRLTNRPFHRDWVHFDDIARACLSAAKSEARAARAFNICSGHLVSTHRVAATLERIVGRDLIAEEAFEGSDRYGDAEPGVLPSLTDGLDWQPRISLEEGLEADWAWATSPAGSAYLLDPPAAGA